MWEHKHIHTASHVKSHDLCNLINQIAFKAKWPETTGSFSV